MFDINRSSFFFKSLREVKAQNQCFYFLDDQSNQMNHYHTFLMPDLFINGSGKNTFKIKRKNRKKME